MRKILILLAALVYVTSGSFAQKHKVQTAWNYYQYDELDKAKTAIDEAAANESTSGMPKTWYYKGLIYQKIYKHEKYGSLEPDALIISYQAYDKAVDIDPKYEFSAEINQKKLEVANLLFQAGVDHYTAKKYPEALKAFEDVLIIIPNDTLATLNAAYSAEKAGDKAKAKGYYNQLIAMNYNEPKMYIFLSNIYKSEGDTVNALSTIQKGRKQFPSDNTLVIEELNIYLASGKDKEALEMLTVAIQADPMNPNLYFAQGTVYDKLNRKTEAGDSYKKAIELKPDYFEAYYNLGAMYFNEAAEMANKANDLKSNDEYNKAKKQFDAKFKEAQPYLEKAHELNPKDTNTMISLKQLYARTGENEKYDKMKAELEKQQ
ncbi:MAG TPA: tetratricopeptide repeat protein [Chitinophagaceae bacterium]|nr:tetratricopeptide repeat protein [Chitinophagaceae bacterium]